MNINLINMGVSAVFISIGSWIFYKGLPSKNQKKQELGEVDQIIQNQLSEDELTKNILSKSEEKKTIKLQNEKSQKEEQLFERLRKGYVKDGKTEI